MSTDAYAFTLAGIAGIAPFQDSPDYAMIGHSAADTLDKVNPKILTLDSAKLALLALWVADHPNGSDQLGRPRRRLRNYLKTG